MLQVYFFLVVLGLCCCSGFSLAVASRGYALVAVSRLIVAFLVAENRFSGSVVVAHGLSCSEACGIFPGPGIEPVTPALAGRFFTTEPPGKPLPEVLKIKLLKEI